MRFSLPFLHLVATVLAAPFTSRPSFRRILSAAVSVASFRRHPRTS
jgi:hypothetical protein